MELWPIHLLITNISTPSSMEWEADSEHRETFEAVAEGMNTTAFSDARFPFGIGIFLSLPKNNQPPG